MNIDLAMAGRYLWGGRNRYARFIAWMSLAGLALGVLVLTLVVSVMNGLGEELRSRILGTVPHALVTPASPGLAEALSSRVDVESAYRFFSSSGMITGNGAVVPVSIFGMDARDGALLREVDDNLIGGPLAEALTQPGAIVMGAPMARHLALEDGDPVVLVVAEPSSSAASASAEDADAAAGAVRPRLKRFRLTATFAIGAELDHYLVLLRRDSFSARERRYLGTDGVRVELADPMNVDRFVEDLLNRDPSLEVETWKENYGELFQAVRIEKALMFLLLLLVVAVAGFNIVSGQTVLGHDKRGGHRHTENHGGGRTAYIPGISLAGHRYRLTGNPGRHRGRRPVGGIHRGPVGNRRILVRLPDAGGFLFQRTAVDCAHRRPARHRRLVVAALRSGSVGFRRAGLRVRNPVAGLHV